MYGTRSWLVFVIIIRMLWHQIPLVVDPKDPTRNHYCGITSLSRLYHHSKKVKRNIKHVFNYKYCERCCRPFSTPTVLERHYEYCSQGKLILEDIPKTAPFQYDKKYTSESPRIIFYADIECYIDAETKAHKPAMIGLYGVLNKKITDVDEKQAQIPMRMWMG